MQESKKPLCILLWNATSVRNKGKELHKLLNELDVDIAMITETWLTPTDAFALPGYTIVRKDRDIQTGKKKHAGGVLIAVHNRIQTEHTTQPKTTHIESVTATIKTTPPITIGAAYVSPANKITSSELDEITNKNATKYYLIGGDYNAKHQLWNNLNRNANGSTLRKHSDAERYQIIHSPTYTHRQPNRRPSNLDIFL